MSMRIVQTKINQHHYNEIKVSSLAVGDVLVFNIFIKRDDDYVIIIEAGTFLSEKIYDKLVKQDKIYISQKEVYKQKLTPKTLYAYIKYNKNNLEKSLHFLYKINDKVFEDFFNSKEHIIDVDSIKAVVKSIILLLQSNSLFLKEIMTYFKDSNKVACHSLHVCIYALNLSDFLSFSDDKLFEIGIAALLHDIGFKKINNDFRDKNSKLSITELEAIQMHSQYSLEIAKKNNIHNLHILDAIIHHHEFQDRSGYPHHLGADKISDFASILCICDVFDALTNNRSHREKNSTFEALNIMMKDENMSHKLNQKYIQVFLKSFH